MKNFKKSVVLLIAAVLLCCIVPVSAQQQKEYDQIKGDTYTMNSFKGWELGTGEKMHGKPARRKVYGYETTHTVRLSPDVDDNCHISVMEFKGCKDYSIIARQDSLAKPTSDFIYDRYWSAPTKGKIKRTSVMKLKNKLARQEDVKLIDWYIQGKENTYKVTYVANLSIWDKWLPEMEKLATSLLEH